MSEKLEDRCRTMMNQHEYKKCEKELGKEMQKNPHSAIPHNLMGILMERENNHVLAMKHFRAACELDPTYIPARYNLEQYVNKFHSAKCAYTEEDCPVRNDSQFEVVYDEHHVGHLVRK